MRWSETKRRGNELPSKKHSRVTRSSFIGGMKRLTQLTRGPGTKAPWSRATASSIAIILSSMAAALPFSSINHNNCSFITQPESSIQHGSSSHGCDVTWVLNTEKAACLLIIVSLFFTGALTQFANNGKHWLLMFLSAVCYRNNKTLS